MPELLTIGVFARAARLSPKALRLYDELGLLRPAAVDDGSGYRLYAPEQLDQARLIAWLRRLGMPLATIRRICDLPAVEAAAEVDAYWQRVLAETADRGRLATFLVDHLSGRGSAMGALGIRYAARSEAGPVRDSNEDTAYAGPRLMAVADGVRGGAGNRASAAAVDALKPLETVSVPAEDLLGALAEAVRDAGRAVGAIEGEAATTLTAMLWSGSQLALAHIGDTRAYRLRGGAMSLITTDHTYVRSLVDQGRLSEAEADTHPQRSLLVRALTGPAGAEADLSVHEAAVGDCYLLCSDGLSAAVPAGDLHTVLTGPGDPRQVLDELIARAYAAGADDNVAAVVADVVAA
ncbi:protein phosphatase [Actinoplanes philippinensis]|uniref:Protein phosphatase n=1 Tax=Actinoplanes philippinensis TaxID=35752 RepID=A0A1I2K349_9ACTN|nr:MerR family transcriptional regulator [Actinoplanes philippinensis]SFF61294.1 protein phosphatase [Actinoplanes philippinensis]